MKKSIFINLIIICNSFSTFALPNYPVKDDSTKQIKTVEQNNLIFLEIAGNGGFLSVNYERFITQRVSLRIGAGTDPPYGIGAYYPIMINYTFELPFEIGFGIVPFSFNQGRIRDDIFADKTKGVVITSLIGFKKTFGWFLVKVSFTPFFNPVNSDVLLYGGLSFGIAF